MADGVLFAPASLLPGVNAVVHRLTIESNIRACEFFVQVFSQASPDPVFKGFVEYALGSVSDDSTATRNVAVFFRDYAAAAPELREFRESLAGRPARLPLHNGPQLHVLPDPMLLSARPPA